MAETDLKLIIKADASGVKRASNQAEGAIKKLGRTGKQAGDATAAGGRKAEGAIRKLGQTGGQAGNAVASGARKGEKAIKRIGTASNKSAVSMRSFALRAVAAAGGIYGFVRAATAAIRTIDQLNALENRLRLVTDSERDLADVQQRLYEISQRSRTGLGETTELYARVAVASGELGRSQGELLQLTELVNKAVAISGATASESSSGIIQFAQGLASNRLQGDELRSVLENLPGLAREIAAGLGVSIGEIRELAAAGKLTANTIIDAILSRQGEIEEAYGSFVPTIAQSYEVLAGSASRFLQLADEQLEVSNALAQAIGLLAEGVDAWSESLNKSKTRDQLLIDLTTLKEKYDDLTESINNATAAGLDQIESRLQEPLADAVITTGQLTSQKLAAQNELQRYQELPSGAKYYVKQEINSLKLLIIGLEEEQELAEELQKSTNQLLRDIDDRRDALGDNKSKRLGGAEVVNKKGATLTAEQIEKLRRDLAKRRAALKAGLLAETEQRIELLRIQAQEEKRQAAEKYKQLGKTGTQAAAHQLLIEQNLASEIQEVRDKASKDLLAQQKKKQNEERRLLEKQARETVKHQRAIADELLATVESAAQRAGSRLDLLQKRQALLGTDGVSLNQNIADAQLTSNQANLDTQLFQGAISLQLAKEYNQIYVEEHKQALREIEEAALPSYRRLVLSWEREAKSMGETLEDAFTKGIESGESAFQEFVRTGKLSISALAGSIVDELSSAFYQSQIAPLLAQFGASLFGTPGLQGGRSAGPGGVLVAHTGGIIGADSLPARSVAATAFANAPRFHTGGLVGAGETPAILRRGEGVFTPHQMRALAPAQSSPQKVVVEIHNEGSQQQEVVSAQPTVRGSDLVIQVVTRDLQRGGPVSQTLSSTFNLERKAKG